MAIIRLTDRPFFRNPWTDFERMRREFDTLFQGLAGEYAGRPAGTVYPALNISEDANVLYVRAEIPGVKATDLDISVEGDTLTISGERATCPKDQKLSYHRREIECGRFSRAITLPTKVNPDQVRAGFVNGVLTITLPKAEAVKPRKIEIKTQ
ncbi:MAG TPA: Hsp20/alpha crystallin family protein [Desulfurivibrionaceae bacterium]|nr:Hsp20/alpha crystallin family protein [Desulfurivibrionaceae bacterium]